MAALSDHRKPFRGFVPAPLLRRIGAALGLQVDDGGVELRRPEAAERGVVALEEALGRPVLLAPARLDTVIELAGLLEGLGRALRAAFVRRALGLDALAAADPAHAEAAGVLFRRLVLSARFRAQAGFEAGEGFALDLAHEEAVRVRLVWARLGAACDPDATGAQASPERFRRSAGRPLPPDGVRGSWESDPRGAASLRGALLAVACEERLLSRWGRDWCFDRNAGRMLMDLWEADPQETAESLSSAIGLGTMDAGWLADRYRP